MRKICLLCKSTRKDEELSEKCLKCSGKKNCPLIGPNSVLCKNCRDKVENRDDSIQGMFENLSDEDKMRLVHEMRTLHISVMTEKMTEKMMGLLQDISDRESGNYSHENKKSPFEDLFSDIFEERPEKNAMDLFSEILGKGPEKGPEKNPMDLLSEIFGKGPEKNLMDLFSEILGKKSEKKPKKNPSDIFSNLHNMRPNPNPFSNFNRKPPFMNN